MKQLAIVYAIALLGLSSCGGSGTGSNSTLSSGEYGFTGRSFVPTDDCNLADDFPSDATIQISVSGSSVTFILDEAPNPTRDPVATIQGNTINAASKTFDKDNNANPPGETFDCVETITITVSGSVTGQNQFQGTIVFSSTPKSGTQCSPTNLHYKTHPCSSTFNFTARKK